MKINEYINNPNFSNELPKICDLLSSKATTATITCLGARVITISGFEGSITLDEISRKVLKTQPDGINTIKMIDSLKNLYCITDNKIEKSGWLTKKLSNIKDFSLFDKPVRIQLDFIKEYVEFEQINLKHLKEKAVFFIENKYYSTEILSYINSIIENKSFQLSPKSFMANWREKRGFTEEFRIAEDSARMFFEQELHI